MTAVDLSASFHNDLICNQFILWILQYEIPCIFEKNFFEWCALYISILQAIRNRLRQAVFRPGTRFSSLFRISPNETLENFDSLISSSIERKFEISWKSVFPINFEQRFGIIDYWVLEECLYGNNFRTLTVDYTNHHRTLHTVSLKISRAVQSRDPAM